MLWSSGELKRLAGLGGLAGTPGLAELAGAGLALLADWAAQVEAWTGRPAQPAKPCPSELPIFWPHIRN